MGQAAPLSKRQELKELLDKQYLTGDELVRVRVLIFEGSEGVRELMGDWTENVRWLK